MSWLGRLVGREGASERSRADLLNHLIQRNGYETYLEIGVRDPTLNFDKIRVRTKHAVDPAPAGPISHKMTSDAFFQHLATGAPGTLYDLVFIDGLHIADQVERDVAHALRHLAPRGTIVLHDVNPLTRDAQTDDYDGAKRWNGTVWKAWAKLRATAADLSMCVVDMDEGCGVIQRGSQTCWPLPTLDYAALDYKYLKRHRRGLLNLVPPSRFFAATTRAA
jgi:Methyltransferase domain